MKHDATTPPCPNCGKPRASIKFEDAFFPGDCQRLVVEHVNREIDPCVIIMPAMIRLRLAAGYVGRNREHLYTMARSRNGRRPLLATTIDPITSHKMTTPAALKQYVEATAWHAGGWPAGRKRKGATK